MAGFLRKKNQPSAEKKTVKPAIAEKKPANFCKKNLLLFGKVFDLARFLNADVRGRFFVGTNKCALKCKLSKKVPTLFPIILLFGHNFWGNNVLTCFVIFT